MQSKLVRYWDCDKKLHRQKDARVQRVISHSLGGSTQ